MIKVRFLRSFDKTLQSLSLKERRKAHQAIRSLLDYFGGGPRPIGLGLRKLRDPYWEIRLSLDKRVLFILEHDLTTFVLTGNHDQIRRRLADMDHGTAGRGNV